jgi:hypothetical protein
MTVQGAGIYGGNLDWAGADPLTEARLEGHPIPRGDDRRCTYPDCIMLAEPGDVYCADCRSGIDRAADQGER